MKRLQFVLHRALAMRCGGSLALLLAGASADLHAQPFAVDWFAVAGGGGVSTGGQFVVEGTIGQADAGGPLTGGNYTVIGGFWSFIAAVQSAGLPFLTIQLTAPGTVSVSWPATATDFVLEENTDLRTTDWVTVPISPTLANGTNLVVVSPPAGNRYYRLAYAVPTPPTLKVEFTNGSTAVITWPAPSAGFVLQVNTSFTEPNWMDVTNLPTVINGMNQVILSPLTGDEYFRLAFQ